jgi:hypothetical protein
MSMYDVCLAGMAALRTPGYRWSMRNSTKHGIV